MVTGIWEERLEGLVEDFESCRFLKVRSSVASFVEERRAGMEELSRR